MQGSCHPSSKEMIYLQNSLLAVMRAKIAPPGDFARPIHDLVAGDGFHAAACQLGQTARGGVGPLLPDGGGNARRRSVNSVWWAGAFDAQPWMCWTPGRTGTAGC